MIENISRHLKAVLVVNDVSDSSCRASRAQCLTVQDYHFDCERPLNEGRVSFGRILPSSLTFTVRVVSFDDCRTFFRWLIDYSIHEFSIVFNAVYDSSQYLRDWDAALVARGYLVEIDENFNGACNLREENKQMTVKMKVLLSDIRFLGECGDKTIDIIH